MYTENQQRIKKSHTASVDTLGENGSREANGFVYYVEDGLAVEVHNIDIRTCVKSDLFVSNGNAKAYGRIMNALTWFASCDDVANEFECFRVNGPRASSHEDVEQLAG